MKKIIVTQRIDHIADRLEMRDALDKKIIEFVHELGCLPFPIPNMSISKIENWLDALQPDGIILSGGNDFGEYQDRDLLEFHLLSLAKARNFPVLGICRGMQIMSLFYSGKLKLITNHVANRHAVNGTISKEVNSFHKYALDGCPEEYEITAIANGDCIEGIKHKNLPWLGWMWHPEREEVFDPDDLNAAINLFGNS